MAPDSMPGALIDTVAVPGTTNLTQPTELTDQSQSRLVTLPKELRNKIYEFVFCDNITYVHELTTYQRGREDDQLVSTHSMALEHTAVEAIFAYVPRPVPLDHTTPPSKESILPCRQLYSEMRRMQIAAYRAYWLKNRFVYTDDLASRQGHDANRRVPHRPRRRLQPAHRLQVARVDFLAAPAPTEQDARRR